MPAQISSAVAEHALAAAKFAQKAGGSTGAADPSTADITRSGSEDFSALIEQLLGKQALTEISSPLLDAVTETSNAKASDAGREDLNALLPFLEAMGLVQDSRKKGDATAENGVADAGVIEGSLAAIAAPVATRPEDHPAINAGNGTQSNLTGTLGAGQTKDVSASENLKNGITTLGGNGQADESSAGREFSEQLVAAIDGSKEQSREPGVTATAVHQVISNASPRHNAGGPTAHSIQETVGAPNWNEKVGDRVVWMANNKESHAELILTPPQMGRVEVKLSISGDQATASFVSPNPQVREALEAALPRLREILADAGVQLGQAQVGAENPRQSAQQDKNGDNFAFDRGLSSTGETAQSSVSGLGASASLKTGRGLVDVFA